MAGLNMLGYALWMTWMSAVAARSTLRGLPPEWIGLMLRMALPVAPKVSDTLMSLQASEHLHQFVASVVT